ncbi:SCO family protein [Marinobacter maroccanus]|uniref:SCO family protein n=1 Tax=Marinobacter maroccanus TaxID=2055143 RepID=A0A2S5ZBX7_9GAMM|nr:SCO family protein [Marinobacter maroccanus]PPI84890.1 SCO family protein [Marinobacter maroccanus]
MNRKTTSILLFATAFLMALALPVMPSLLNNTGFYGMSINEPGEDLNGYQPPKNGLAVIFFGYRQCGTVCPVQLVNLLDLSQRLKDAPVEFLFVTLDPDNDTPEALQQTTASLGEAFRSYRPDTHQSAQKLASAYNDFAVKQGGASNDSIAHSARLHVVTPDFRRKLIYTTPDLNLELVEQDLRRLLKANTSESAT